MSRHGTGKSKCLFKQLHRCHKPFQVDRELACESAHCPYFRPVTATLTELHRDTSKVVRTAIRDGEKVILTEHGEPCAELVPVRKLDRQQALQDLIAIGPVDFLPRR